MDEGERPQRLGSPVMIAVAFAVGLGGVALVGGVGGDGHDATAHADDHATHDDSHDDSHDGHSTHDDSHDGHAAHDEMGHDDDHATHDDSHVGHAAHDEMGHDDDHATHDASHDGHAAHGARGGHDGHGTHDGPHHVDERVRAEAEAFRRATVAAMAPFRDLEVALAAGFVRNPRATEPLVHYPHPAHRRDNRVLDPNALEGLVYAFDVDGNAFLVAALYTARPHEAIPPPGSPLVRWHVHGQPGCHHPDHDPGCKDVPGMRMLHVWDFPGVRNPFGDGWSDAIGPNPRERLAEHGIDIDGFLGD